MTLPSKLSELIRVSLADLRKVERDTRYSVDMGQWHTPAYDGLCHVCLAGAVMAGTMGADPDDEVVPCRLHMDEADAQRLEAIDALRCGDVSGALYIIAGDEDADYISHPLDRCVVDYSRGAEAFHAAMAELAADLEGIDL